MAVAVAGLIFFTVVITTVAVIEHFEHKDNQ